MQNQSSEQTKLPIPRLEFIALCAALMALNALAIDIMLPGLQEIGASLGVTSENNRQFVITAYLIGFAFAQLVYGPLSDSFGRRGPLLVGMGIYSIASIAAAFAPSFEFLLICRAVQGIGAAATRVIVVSVVRDTFGGRAMAEIMSLIFMIFMVIPVIAPLLGQGIMLFGDWHYIFVVMAIGCALIAWWTATRLPETLHPEYRRALNLGVIAQGFKIVVTNRMAILYTIATTFIFGALFGFINSAQQVYVGIYGIGVWFPVVFAGIASLMSISSFLNSRLVGRLGMRRLSHAAIIGYFVTTGIWLTCTLIYGQLPLAVFIGFFAIAMLLFGWIGSNLNTIAMEPLGHLAGTASSVFGFIQTLGGALIGALIGQAFDGTTIPMVGGFCFVSAIAIILILIAENGKLFAVHHDPIPPIAEKD
ncbi:multidrug effflux MFS transporter [Limoniibacter endophyticus]|uniref:Bcr/CflA family efflux transporter n=1 Tax=Limoniibacter endophyticus TaxID=1565040 RepID=A0A8J3GFT7_9HYPH|nr:multidrug effflux MFS transporter [Limoniibacter endophyticus]GHC60621.1 Bcr/CflA family drug resistance efflux transporter [Limoniibacter endophyticus]